MPFLEADEALVNKKDYDAALYREDKEAAARIGRELNGVVLYCHALSIEMTEEHAVVTIRDLELLGVVKSVKLECATSSADVRRDPLGLEKKLKREKRKKRK